MVAASPNIDGNLKNKKIKIILLFLYISDDTDLESEIESEVADISYTHVQNNPPIKCEERHVSTSSKGSGVSHDSSKVSGPQEDKPLSNEMSGYIPHGYTGSPSSSNEKSPLSRQISPFVYEIDLKKKNNSFGLNVTVSL